MIFTEGLRGPGDSVTCWRGTAHPKGWALGTFDGSGRRTRVPSLTTSDVNTYSCAYWPFVCLSWRKVDLCPLPISNYIVCIFILMSYIYIPSTSPLSDRRCENTCSHSVGGLLTFFMVPFEAPKFLIFMMSHLSIISFDFVLSVS